MGSTMKYIILLQLLLSLSLAVGVERERQLDWWETTVYYQIYPRSFMDSDGDGIGDLNGITSKLEYLKELGIEATWLSPMFKSPMYDFGYDISDFYDIHDEYGTMEDFDRLMAKANELDIKIILDYVPNHTSNESVWFQEALKGNRTYYDYFIWEDGVVDEKGNLGPPNNWLSIFQRSAWEYKEETGQYYLHQFVIGQPDLNFRNPAVVEEMKNVLRFWLDKGVAGFRVDAIMHLFEVDKEEYGGRYPDEPLSGDATALETEHGYLSHIYTTNQDESYDMILQWREVLDEYLKKDNVTRVMMTEAYTTPLYTVRYFGEGDKKGAHIPFNFALISDVTGDSLASELKIAVDKFMTYKPLNELSNWVIGNHDNRRVASKFSPELVDGFNMMALLLPGIGVTYQGDEIGMIDGVISWEDTVDPGGCNTNDPINYVLSSRDPFRTPFQWSADKNAGFSTANKTWLPVTEGYETLNVEVQSANAKSHLNIYKALVKLRAEPTFRFGRYESAALNDDVFAFRRWHNREIYVALINLREQTYEIDLTYFENVTGDLETVLSSSQSPKTSGEVISANNVPLAAGESVLLKVKV